MSRRGMNWGAIRARSAMRRRGTEDSRDDSASMVRRVVAEHSTIVRRPRPTKDELRADAVRAFMEWRARRAAEARE